MFKISVLLDNGVRVLEKTDSYVAAWDMLDLFKAKYGKKIVESSIIGSDRHDDVSK
jgi:hypothetical protein